MESIFKGQPDLAKQLSRENAAFIQIDKVFRLQSARIYKEQNCYRALIVNERDFIKTLTEMNRGLEAIQKELRSFLESKRTQFPRFYFLANDDLLEIIGQGKNPEPINKHIKKFFEGINAIKTDNGTGKGADKVYIIKQIKAIDDETIELDGDNAVKTNTNVENWLNHLITSMKKGLQKLFSKYQNQIANSTSKRSMEKETMHKIIVDNLGQILITMSQIEWTTQVRTALKDMADKGAEGNQNPMRKVKKMWQQKVSLLIECVEKQGLPARERNKIISLIIIEEHNRQVIDNIANNKACNNPGHFDWTQQLRFERNDGIEQTQD